MSHRLQITILATLGCALACGPRQLAIEGDDEAMASETTTAETQSSESEADTESESDGGCLPQPEVIPCEPDGSCPEGFKCAGYQYEDCFGQPGGDVGCVPVVGDQAVGQSCTITYEQATPMFTWQLDDCDAEGTCLKFVNGSPEGICVPHCEVDGPSVTCEDPSRLCQGGPIYTCLQLCDPTAPEQNCEGELDCGGHSNSEFYCSTAFFGPGEGQLGYDCDSEFDCADGLGCVDGTLLPDCPDDANCCSPFCSLVDSDPCAGLGPEFTCLPFYDEGQAPASFEHVGLCGSP